MTATWKINIGNYEGMEFTFFEEYPLAPEHNPDKLRAFIVNTMKDSLMTAGATLVSDISVRADERAGHLAIKLKQCADEGV